MKTLDNINIINSVDAMLEINGVASVSTESKVIDSLEEHSINFIERSPFVVLATHHEGADVSPRGDEPGFVKVLDANTLLIPERPGNRLADSMRNIIQSGAVGMLFMIPGMDDTLRINGFGRVTDHAPYLDMMKHKGKPPKLAIVVDVKEVFLHCPKAFIRSKLWDPKGHIDRSTMPTLGKMILDQVKGGDVAAAEVDAVDAMLDQDNKENLYHS
jgi:PPOX class probable FMN-dependent enzyme